MGNNLINGFVFAPPEPATYTNAYPHQTIYLTTKSKKKIPAYFLKNSQNVKTTILYSHGNAADIGVMYDFLRLLSDNLPVNVLHYEYVGYGLAKGEGQPCESYVYESIESAFDYLTNKESIPANEIIVFGTSVGSGPSCHLASKKQIKGLILECPFTSIVRIVTGTIFGKMVDMFENVNKIDKVNCPVLMFHGMKDDVVPFDHGKELYGKVKKDFQYKFVEIKNADHHDIIEKLTVIKYLQTIKDFIDHCDIKSQERVVQNNSTSTTTKSGNGSLFSSVLS